MWLSPRLIESTTDWTTSTMSDGVSGLGEGLGERQADIARTDDRDVPAHAREGYRAAAM